MKKALILFLIASLLLAGCKKNVGNIPQESAAVTTETTEAGSGEKPRFEHEWQALYYDELAKYIDIPGAMFNIYDLDADGTPELLLSEGGFHAAGGALYTVCQGELINLGSYGGWGEFQYDFERNFIYSGYTQMGSEWFTVYSFENGGITKVVSFYSYDGAFPDTEEEYKINDEAISQEVFNAEYEKYSFEDRKDFIVRKYDITQSTIERILRQY